MDIKTLTGNLGIYWILQKWKVSKLKEYKGNPRRITKTQYAKLKEKIEKFGIIERPCINTDGTIIGGHQRKRVFKDLGIKELEVWVPSKELSEELFIELNMVLNKIGGTFDEDLVANNFSPEQLIEMGWEPHEMGGFDPEKELLEVETKGEDAVPKESEEIFTVKGDVYEFGKHRLMCGDATAITDVEKLIDGIAIDLVYTDPPYGANIVKPKDGKLTVGGKGNEYQKIIGDDSPQTAIESFNLAQTLCKNLIFWGSEYYANKIPASRGWIVWDKENTGDFGDGELAYTSFNKPIKIFKHMWNGFLRASEKGEKRCHPTQKPVALAEFCFDSYAKDSKNVLDLFGGSGSTLIACEKTNRNCFMMELSPAYCDIIINRWVEYMEKNGREVIVKRNGKVFEVRKGEPCKKD